MLRRGEKRMTHLDCLDCLNRDYCEHTSMDFCMVGIEPAWMAHSRFYDSEIGECSKIRRRPSRRLKE